MPKIFISYAREDRDDAEQLAFEFGRRGAHVWWDRDLVSGEPYIEAILRQVAECDAFLLLLSKYSATSIWVGFEVGAARARERAGSDPSLLKIGHLDECEVPGFVGERQATPLRGSSGMEDILSALGLPISVDEKNPVHPDKSLQIFRAGSQWMELVVSRRGLECILANARDQRARVQWSVPPEEVGALSDQIYVNGPVEGQSWSTFSIGGFYEWRWSPPLFSTSAGGAPEEAFRDALVRHLATVSEFS